ncbi:tripartite tricarboxylate transporter TctB family protein [Caldimonas aquatica]|uniref:Tripartite tricarboxylate transporter TctB family protein n=1 Tax=Caldimonas aquatica TaxID=376175 RepID=A0ABY6MN13_9BURK|nr:tripartite tricarboxylate transporter TctB family protein [Schlegelella aquatica]UZD53899.1 tripartite tricarboxylate transporter TctB family protein [Schlegelella aquatica]
MKDRRQWGVGAGVLVLAAVLALGALDIPSAAGYAGVGPNFLPWVVAGGLAVCGVLLLREAFAAARAGAQAPTPPGPVCWRGLGWVSAGLLLNALLVTRLGFVLGCTVLFVCAARGFRLARGGGAPARTVALDTLVGVSLSAPAYWIFTKALGLTLPGLTATGWI